MRQEALEVIPQQSVAKVLCSNTHRVVAQSTQNRPAGGRRRRKRVGAAQAVLALIYVVVARSNPKQFGVVVAAVATSRSRGTLDSVK